eukprot:PhF_6_TR24930/c0_g1_i1/m.34316
MFLAGCSSLTSLDTSGNTGVTPMDTVYFFSHCKSLTAVNTSERCHITSSRRDAFLKVSGEFFLVGCTSLRTFDTSSLTRVTSIGLGFVASCTALTAFDIGLTGVT